MKRLMISGFRPFRAYTSLSHVDPGRCPGLANLRPFGAIKPLKKAFHSPFDELRTSGMPRAAGVFPLMLSLSKHEPVEA
jgi:hypothetical protein